MSAWILAVLLAQPVLAASLAFEDVTAQSGVDFVHTTGARDARWLPETMGSGVAIFDADGDGHMDLYFADGRAWDGRRGGVLYRGQGKLRFARTGDRLAPELYGMGAVAADLDDDGAQDLVLSGLEGLFLLRGDGHGGFAAPRSLADGWCTATCALDADGDAKLEIFAGRYVEWSPQSDIWCSLDGAHKSYCTPELYAATTPLLLRADGTALALPKLQCKVLGAVANDMDGDGWTDLVVANDTMPDLYLRSLGDGSFEEIGLASGMALSPRGLARAGMGIDIADFAGDGRPGIAVGHFSGETMGLYRALRPNVFFDEAARRGLAEPTLPELTFGLLCVDLDLDGRPDLVTANGHIESEIAKYRPSHSYRQALGVYRNLGESFSTVPVLAGRDFVGRGLAAGDLDDDGDLDLVLTQNGDGALILRNEADPPRWLRVDLNSLWAAGSTIVLRTDRRELVARVHLGNSYLSCSAPQACFGLQADETPQRLSVKGGGGRTREQDIDASAGPHWRLRLP